MTKKHSAVWAVLAFFCGILCIIGVWYVDFEIISPMILPEDYCYYHFNPAPFWVDLLYMNGGSNGHPDGSLIHFLMVIVLGALLGHFITKAVRLNIAPDETTPELKEVLDDNLG